MKKLKNPPKKYKILNQSRLLCFQVNVCSVCNPSPPTILISLSKFHREKSKERKLPLSEETTSEFIHWQATDRKLSAGTISSYLAGIRQLHVSKGLPDPRKR
jgi:hypothetical protein